MKILTLTPGQTGSTGLLYEGALRRLGHQLVTCGPSHTDPRDIVCSTNANVPAIVERLRRDGFFPDWVLWIDCGLAFPFLPQGLVDLSVPTVGVLIDTHWTPNWHVRLAKMFDLVFVAERRFIDWMHTKGAPHVTWMPLAADLGLHGPRPEKKIWDVGFIGATGKSIYRDRTYLLETLQRRFKVLATTAPPSEIGRLFSQSRIIFNRSSTFRGLTARVFEGMASGSLLLTDRLPPGQGLELFQDRYHLVLYDDDQLEDLVAYYLAHEREREQIAAAGMLEVHSKHTFNHRVETIVHALERLNGKRSRRATRLDIALANYEFESIVHASKRRSWDYLPRVIRAPLRRAYAFLNSRT